MGMFIYSKPELASLQVNTKTKAQCKKKYCKKKYKTNGGNTCEQKYCTASYCKKYCKRFFG